MRGNRSGERLPFGADGSHPHRIRPRAARLPSPERKALEGAGTLSGAVHQRLAGPPFRAAASSTQIFFSPP